MPCLSSSPYVSRRLITEQELVGAAINAHGPDKAFKFIEEVFGALTSKDELVCLRPSIWSDYVVGLEGDLTVLEKAIKRLRAGYLAAIDGETGIEWL